MGRIQLLPDALASQVAAGEVVERPASVVKELIENSIDAEAAGIEVRVRRGGISLIEVRDDGTGMNRDDALMCLERHATSKIACAGDLDGIATLGFRGEAVPSIASVSKFRLATREKAALSGTEITVNGGKLLAVRDSGVAPGTAIEVRSLFYNIPARRKFLRTENTEYGHVEQQVRIQAIAHCETGFTLYHNDRQQFRLPARSALLERIQGLIGTDLASRLLEVEPTERDGIEIRGYIGGYGMGRSNRSLQLTFLNGRPVEAAVLNYALREGYHTALMKGQYPVVFLFLSVNPFAVDVNVHPAKKEVRFRDGNSIRDATIAAIRQTLTRPQTTLPGQKVHRVVAELAPREPAGTGSSELEPDAAPALAQPAPAHEQPALIPQREQTALREDWWQPPAASATAAEMPSADSQASEPQVTGSQASEPQAIDSQASEPQAIEFEAGQASCATGPVSQSESPTANTRPAISAEDFRVIGVLGKLYIIMEGAEGMVLMDQHAAHERILFEQMRDRMNQQGVPTQKLLIPITMELAPRDFDLINQNLDVLQQLGIAAEPFGLNTLKIDGLPAFFKHDDPAGYMSDVVEELKRNNRRMPAMRLGEDMVATTVCRYAVKANDKLRGLEIDSLLAKLLECEMPYCCPHGRPTLIQISFNELEKKFGRQVP